MDRKKLFLFLILLLGFSLRIWKVVSIPPGLNRDEKSIGYTAYSILKTGKDEYGTGFPLSIKSFGDWKLPLYIYLDIIPLKLFSLNELTVRIPSILFGWMTIAVTYLLTLELLRLSKYKLKIAFISALLLTISPWHVHFSREASEANISVFLVSLGLWLFLKGLDSKTYLLLSSIILALSLYTYHANHIFTVLFFLALVSILLIKRAKVKRLLIFITPFIILAAIIFNQTLFSADLIKFSSHSPLSNEYLIHDNIDLARLSHNKSNFLLSKLLHNKLFLIAGNFVEVYSRSFSPEFLFLKGGLNFQHNIPGFGNLYLVESFFFILGIYFIFSKQYKWRWLLFYWLIISPLPSAVTLDAPNSARMLGILPLPHILSAVAIREIFLLIKNKHLKYFYIAILLLLFMFNFTIYLDRYYVHFPQNRESAWGAGYKNLISEVNLISKKYSEVIIDHPDYSPYIHFLFYNRTDPEIFQREVIRYPIENSGLQHVKRFQQLEFRKLDWSYDLLIPGRLIISWADSTPPYATKSSILIEKPVLDSLKNRFGQSFNLHLGDEIISRLVKVIRLKNNQPQFYLIEVKKLAHN